MSRIVVESVYPIPWRFEPWVRNPLVPDQVVPSSVCWANNFALTRLRKTPFTKSASFQGLPQGQSGTTRPWRFYFRTGTESPTAGDVQVYVQMLLAPADNAGATDPYCYWEFDDGAATINSTEVHFATIDTGAVGLDELHGAAAIATLDADTEYECALAVVDYCRVVSATIWEFHPRSIDTDDAYGLDHRLYFDGADITDTQHKDINDAIDDVWNANAAHLFSLAQDDINTPWTTTSASFVNMLDGSATGLGNHSWGYRLYQKYHNMRHTTDIDIFWGVYASTDAGSAGEVRLVDANGTVDTITGIGTSAQWHTSNTTIDASLLAPGKLDIQFRDTAGNTLTVEAVSAFEGG